MSVRLQLEGAAPRLVARESDRLEVPRALAVVAASERMREPARTFRKLVSEAAIQSGLSVAQLEVAQRQRDGVELVDRDGVSILRAGSDCIVAELERALDRQARADLVLADGLSFIALARPALAVVLAPSESLVHWDPGARELRDRFEIVLYDARRGLADRLVERLCA